MKLRNVPVSRDLSPRLNARLLSRLKPDLPPSYAGLDICLFVWRSSNTTSVHAGTHVAVNGGSPTLRAHATCDCH